MKQGWSMTFMRLFPAYLPAVLLAIGLLVVSPAAAQPSQYESILDDPIVRFQVQRGLDLLYDMQFEQADKLFNQVDRRYPNHPAGPFLKALSTWWEILLDLSDTSHDEAFFAQMEEVIERSDRLLKKNKDNFDAIFFKGAALGFRGRLRSNRGDWYKSALDGKRAMDYVLRVARKDPSNADYAFGKGIYDYYAAAIPDRYPFVKPVMIFFPRGDRARGIRALEWTARDGVFIQTEAAYFLLQIYYLFERDFEKSVEYVNWLRKEHPNNPFFHTFEGRVYAHWGKWGDAGAIFSNVLARYEKKMPGYNQAMAEQALYYRGRAHMVYARYDEAIADLTALRRLSATKPGESYFEVWGRLREGMAYDAAGYRDRAVACYREVLSMDNRADVHDMARRFLNSPYRGVYSSPANLSID